MRARSLGAVALLVASFFAASVFVAPAAFASPFPDAPQFVHFRALSTTSASLSWTPPHVTGDGPLTGYQWQVTGPDSYDVSGSTGPSTTTVPISNLVPGSLYTARVTASNEDATSPAGTTTLTVPTSFLGSPTGVQITPHQTTADVSWTPPAETGESAITGYQIQFLGGSGFVNIPVGLATSYTLTGLNPGTQYVIVVSVSNDTNTEITSGDPFTTLAYSAPGAPSHLEVTRDTDGSGFTVTFDAPTNDGGDAIDAYTATATDGTAGGSSAESVDPGDLSADFTDRVIGDDYTISVTATNSLGTGTPATADFTLDAVAPTAVRNLTLVDNGHGVLEADWTAPEYDGGSDLVGFHAVVTDGLGTNYSAESVPDGHAGQALFDVPVTFAADYTVAVEPLNSVGSGPSVISDAVRTVAATVPAAPTLRSLTVGDLHDPFMEVGWDSHGDGGAPITSYTLRLYDVSQTLVRTVTVAGDVDHYRFNGLSNNGFYSITFTATNAVGESDPSGAAGETGGSTLTGTPPAPSSADLAARGLGFLDGVSVNGHTVTAHFDDAAGSWVYGYVYSSPQKLGWAQVDADGDASWTLPTLDAGIHHLAVLDSTGFLLGSGTFTILDPALASTGLEVGAPIGVALAALIAGAVLLLRGRRRRIAG